MLEFTAPRHLKGAIPEPVTASAARPPWWKAMPKRLPATRPGQSGLRHTTVKGCPSFIDALGAGYMLGLPCALQVDTNADGVAQFAWNSGVLRPVGPPHADAQMAEHSGHDHVYKLDLPWTTQARKGWSVLWIAPVNRVNTIEILSGVIEADRWTGPGNFPFLWHGEPGTRVVLDAGTPVAQAVPFKRSRVSAAVRYADEETMTELRAPQLAADHHVNGYRRLFHVPKVWSLHTEDR